MTDGVEPFITENILIKCVETCAPFSYLVKTKIIYSDGTIFFYEGVANMGKPEEYIGEEAAEKWIIDNIFMNSERGGEHE